MNTVTVVSGGCVTRWSVEAPLTVNGSALCPDLLDHRAIGVADGWRGRVVRAFFWLMRAWPPVGRGRRGVSIPFASGAPDRAPRSFFLRTHPRRGER